MVRIGRIYCISCPGNYETYIGSTFNTLTTRFNQHKELKISSKVLMMDSQVGIKLLEEVRGISKIDLLKLEQKYQDETDHIVNQKRAYLANRYDKKDCLCGASVVFDQFSRHTKSKKHLFYEKIKNFIYI